MEWLNYHHLLYFWKVARSGSIANASKELLLAPPTISAQVSHLEDTLGEKLFVRSGRRLVLTEAGRVAYRLIAPALRVADQVRVVCREDRPDKLLAELAVNELDVVLADAA